MNQQETLQLGLDGIIELEATSENIIGPEQILPIRKRDNIPFTKEEILEPSVHVITRAQVHRPPKDTNPLPGPSSESQPIASRLQSHHTPSTSDQIQQHKVSKKSKQINKPEEQPIAHRLRSQSKSAITSPPKTLLYMNKHGNYDIPLLNQKTNQTPRKAKKK
jgi:hypothetical protein